MLHFDDAHYGLGFDHPDTVEALRQLTALRSVQIRSTAPFDLSALAARLAHVTVTAMTG
ncbi:hypothetical protein [Saccharothrix sp.]|uniref:hypothetical protein n=1 Tax=Saccharothrix sp. TaxID=1873460 RepID=UPI0028113926|nr:hypothetical protein [Saccharothrix sp.]